LHTTYRFGPGLSPLEWAIVTAAFLNNLTAVQTLLGLLLPGRRTMLLTNPLRMVVRMGYYDMVLLLLDNGADINGSFAFDKWACGHGTALEQASLAGSIQVVELLLNPHYQLKTFGPAYEEGILKAAKCRDANTVGRNSYKSIIRILLDRGRWVNLPLLRSKIMCEACHFGREDIVRMMLDDGADGEAKRHDGRTPLYIAAEMGHAGIVQLLLSRGVRHRRDYGADGMRAAALNGHAHVMQVLFDNGDDINYDGQLEAANLFTLAADSSHIEVMQCFVRNGLCLEVSNCGAEALHDTVQENKVAVVNFLLGKGLSMNDVWQFEKALSEETQVDLRTSTLDNSTYRGVPTDG
jgi:ankyrin repeat protein